MLLYGLARTAYLGPRVHGAVDDGERRVFDLVPVWPAGSGPRRAAFYRRNKSFIVSA